MKYLPLLFLLLPGCVTEPHSGQDCTDQGSTNAHFGIIGLAASIHCYGTASEPPKETTDWTGVSEFPEAQRKYHAAQCAKGVTAYCQ